MAKTERLFTLKMCDDGNTTLKIEYISNSNCSDNFLIANNFLDNHDKSGPLSHCYPLRDCSGKRTLIAQCDHSTSFQILGLLLSCNFCMRFTLKLYFQHWPHHKWFGLQIKLFITIENVEIEAFPLERVNAAQQLPLTENIISLYYIFWCVKQNSSVQLLNWF